MLKNAGKTGVRSDDFYAAFMPRAAARIKDLKDEGHKIISKPDKGFVRYVLVR